MTGDERRLLRESAARALAAACPLRALCAGTADAAAIARRHWQIARDMGWPGLLVAADEGGAGMDCRALAVLAEEMGARFFCGPFLSTAVLGAGIATLAARHGRMTGMARAIADGAMVLAGAFVPGRDEASGLAVEPGPGRRLTGRRDLVEHPDLATHFLVLDIGRRSDGSCALLAASVPAGTGIRVTARQPLDVSCPIATVAFERAAVPEHDLLQVVLAAGELDALLRPSHVAVAAELVGVARSALDRAVAYAKERQQFGQPIGKFQAIKHRLADGFVLVANARLAVAEAAEAEDDAGAVQYARVLAADAALKVAADYVQIQGGLGISWESDAHLHLKRARRLAACLGSSQAFRHAIVDRFVASVLSGPAPAGGQAAGIA